MTGDRNIRHRNIKHRNIKHRNIKYRNTRLGGKMLARVGWLAAVLAVILVPGWVCAQEAASSSEVAAFSEPTLGSLRTAFGAYDELRGELAADRLEGVPSSASKLADALRLALEDRAGLVEAIPGVIEETAAIAESMAQAEDLEAARITFGEVSRGLLRLGDFDPRLTAGWYVFACPMAKGFERWIQSTETMANPYMGPAMLACGTSSDWSVPVRPSAEEVQEARAAKEPEFKPGIPGLMMEDVRDQKFLWREIEQLQTWERSDRISIAEFRSKAIEKTAHYLGIGGAGADEFATVASGAVASIRESFHQERVSGQDPTGLQSQFSSNLNAAVSRVQSFFKEEPRHQLFAPECKKWLLKLAFGPREAEEAREAKQAQASPSGRRAGEAPASPQSP